MITWRPKTHISHLPVLRLTPEQFTALPIYEPGMMPYPDHHKPGYRCKVMTPEGVPVVGVLGEFWAFGTTRELSYYRPVIVVRADMKVAP